ncbi:hypothetical protein CK203_000235 [Vitis vinifera]|uniref:Vacuolar protein sorting-associated protein 13 VPS13 adaptor binding domain-containing protein n=1 Tax=Vitis vinifera TaxID=29760 RepID=A0A438KQP9_VITVI|nr:hypothetical protein CK203_000235 [Vitis vinifera]
MFFATAISKKLVSLLRPWLQQEPELELKLGFLRSNGIAKNLRFDTSVLNQLIDDSPGLSFKDVRVDHLSFQLSYCSFPALTIGVRGVHVTLSGGELKEERRLTPRDTYSEDMKKILALIDPEGTALHDMLERISGTTLSRNSLTTSFLNVILNHCRLEIHDIHMQVQFSMSTDSFGCLFEMKELSMESQYLKHGCLLKGLVGALFAPLKESCFVIDGRGFEIRLKREEHINCVLPAVDLFACIKFKDLQPVDISLRVPQVSFALSPLDLPIILAFDVLLSKDLSVVVGLWIRHVNTYEYLLSQVGYSADCLVKRSAVKISEDKMFSNSVKHNWNVISEIEKELPAEAIAQARRIARYRAALNVQHAGDVTSSSAMEDLVGESSSRNSFGSLKGHQKEKINDSKTILWENLLEEMSLSWQRTSLKFEGSEIQFLENPCILLGIKSFLISSGLRDLDPGLWSCCLTVGKLNFSLGYSSILSVALLCKQIQHALCWAQDNGKSRVISHSPETIEDLPETNLSSRYKFYAREMKTAIIGMLPEKRVELGVLIAGPHIQMSLRKEGFNGSNEDMNHVVDQDDFELAFDVHNIELALWPMPNSEIASSIGHLGLNDVEPQSLSWKEPRIIDTPKSDDENHKSQSRTSLSFYLKINGLNAYWEASDKNQESKIFALKPITVQSSSFRESLHSFSTTFVAFSAAVHGVATGFTFLLSMDELYVFLQVVVSLFSSISLAFTTVNSMDCVHCQEFMRQEVIFASPESEEKLAAIATRASLISKRILFVVNGTFQLNSVDIILQDSRKSDKMEGYLKTINGLSAKNLDEVPEDGIWISVHQTCFVISCEEGKLEVHTDLSRIQSVVFRSQSPIETRSVTNALDGFTSGDISPSTIATETSNLHSLGLNQALGFASINLEPASSHWLLINISVSEIFLVRSTVKNVLAGAHQMNKLLSSLSVGGEFQTISWAVQGGFVFLETTAVVKTFHCFASYACCITDLLSVMSSSLKHIEKTEHSPNMARLDDLSIEEHVQETLSTSQQVRWALFEAFTMGISQISIVLVAEDESGKFRELVLEADIRLDLELVNMRKKFMLDLSSLSILSQILCGSVKNEIQIPHFASGISNDLLSHSLPGDPTIAFQRKDGTHPVPDGASSSSDPVSKRKL